MREERKGIRCDMGFGKDAASIISLSKEDDSENALPNILYVGLANPMPTGDHWKAIEWVTNFRRHGASTLTKVPNSRRDFIKAAAAALSKGGFYMEITSMAARKFRDDNDLRMQRGKVYVFVSSVKKSEENEESASS